MYIIIDNIVIPDKKDLLSIHLFIKSKQYGVHLSEGVRDMVVLLYQYGPIKNKDDYDKFITLCNKSTTLKSKDTVRNVMSDLIGYGILISTGKYIKSISEKWIPDIDSEELGLEYKLI